MTMNNIRLNGFIYLLLLLRPRRFLLISSLSGMMKVQSDLIFQSIVKQGNQFLKLCTKLFRPKGRKTI